MKIKGIILIAIFIVSCTKKDITIDYPQLIGKHISDKKVKELFNYLGSDYKQVNAYDMHYYGYDDLGIQLNFSDSDTLRIIYFSKDIKDLPYGLKMHFNRDVVENKLGKADYYKAAASNYIAYYKDKNLIIRYKDNDSLSMINPIKKVLVANVNEDSLDTNVH